ncbi:putative glycoside hydrolase [Saccharopolyspora shandongensis]|uniref:putative glycoside hydrolase n=1 Tax=Saccharopolyspora shandongensis TaxID=418495 RepID=UPI0033E15F80
MRQMREHRRNPLALAANGAEQSPLIKATPYPGSNGVRVSWLDDKPGQFYLQTANQRDSIDLSSYVDNGAALVFDAVLHAPPPDDTTKIAVRCQYPCVAALPVGQKAAVKIPLSCFVSAGLDPKIHFAFPSWRMCWAIA